jgi:hypothetical protein
MANTYVVPLSMIGFFDEKVALDHFIKVGALTKFSAWWNKATLVDLIQDFRLGMLSPFDFKERCAKLFPALAKMDNDVFFNDWQSACVIKKDRIESVNQISRNGHRVHVIGDADSLQYEAICKMINGQLNVSTVAVSYQQGKSGKALVRAMLERAPDQKIYIFSSPPPPLPYENLGVFRWVIDPFGTFFCLRKRAEREDFMPSYVSGKELVEISCDGDLIHYDDSALIESPWEPSYTPIYTDFEKGFSGTRRSRTGSAPSAGAPSIRHHRSGSDNV